MPNFKFTGPYETAYFFPPDEVRPNGATLVVKPGDVCEFDSQPELQYWAPVEEEAPEAPEVEVPEVAPEVVPEPEAEPDDGPGAEPEPVTGQPAPPAPVPFQWSGQRPVTPVVEAN